MAFISPSDIAVGQALPEVKLSVTYEKVVMTPMATWDTFPGHCDPFYAQQQGQKTIYLNTIALQGFSDRVATDWVGPSAFIARRRMAMKASVYAGDELTGTGQVTGHSIEGDHHRIDLVIQLRTQSAPVCDVQTTLLLPRHPA